jgi:hypothetical protein
VPAHQSVEGIAQIEVGCLLSRNSESCIEIIDASPVLEFSAVGKDGNFGTDSRSSSIDETIVSVVDRGVAGTVIITRMFANGVIGH